MYSAKSDVTPSRAAAFFHRRDGRPEREPITKRQLFRREVPVRAIIGPCCEDPEQNRCCAKDSANAAPAFSGMKSALRGGKCGSILRRE